MNHIDIPYEAVRAAAGVLITTYEDDVRDALEAALPHLTPDLVIRAQGSEPLFFGQPVEYWLELRNHVVAQGARIEELEGALRECRNHPDGSADQ